MKKGRNVDVEDTTYNFRELERGNKTLNKGEGEEGVTKSSMGEEKKLSYLHRYFIWGIENI